MANPNSLLTLVRRAIVKIAEPRPEPGTAWCIDCALYGGQTLDFPVESIHTHVSGHSGEAVNIAANYKEPLNISADNEESWL